MERRGCARTFARPPLRSAGPPGLVARKGEWDDSLRADFRARIFEERRFAGLVARKGQWKEEAAGLFCAPSFEERRSPRTGGQEGPMERRGCAQIFARPPLRSAASPGTGGQEGPMEGKVARGLLRALL